MTQHIVVVDDAETNLEILSAMVADIPGAVVHSFTVSQDAMTWAGEHHADAFLVDYNMPDPDGLAMIGLLRADPRYRLVPIVVVTAQHEFDIRLAALAAGANDFLERPIERREVLSRIQTLLALQAARAVLTEQVGNLEHYLRLEERKSRAQAERLAALWRVANASYDLRDDDTVQAVLSEGAATIRGGHPFFGSLLRIEDDGAVLLAAARSKEVVQAVSGLVPVGARLPLADMAEQFAVGSGMTRSWNDIADHPDVARLPRIVALQERALISTPFRVGRTMYVLSFGSAQPVSEPFGQDDHTYVQLLADFFASRLQQAAQSDQLVYHMTHDVLTGLRNRTQFRLDARSQLAADRCGALVVVSMDAFRGINDGFGHIIGDALLVEIGAALGRTSDPRDVVGRLAGDTFGIFLADVATHEALRSRLETIALVFTHPFSTGDREGKEFIPVGATLGAAFTADGTVTIDQLLARADTATFAAKLRGPGQVEIYRAAMESEVGSRVRRLSEISHGLEHDEFELFFQPHLDLQTSRVTGAEALIRWRHPTQGLLLPADFLPFAEHNGLIRTVTRWVTSAALIASQRLRTYDPTFRLFFNLSAIDFTDDNIVNDMRTAAASGLHLENVGIELTETVAMNDVGTAVRTVRQLQELGLYVAIDDFGTGYSSLSMLNRLPIDIIKIDRSFISGVTHGDRDSAIASSIIVIGRQLGYDTLAEGVETPEQLSWCRTRGCRYAQGYNIARPMSLETFEQWLADRPVHAA